MLLKVRADNVIETIPYSSASGDEFIEEQVVGGTMSCLTRNMQKQLRDYIKRNVTHSEKPKAESIRNDLVNRGVCPSSVTADQLEVIMEGLNLN